MSQHVIAIALKAANDRHSDNLAIQAIVQNLKTAMETVRIHDATAPFDILAGYQKGAQGEEGYGLMHSIDATLLSSTLLRISNMRSVATITEVLVAALNACGEEIDL